MNYIVPYTYYIPTFYCKNSDGVEYKCTQSAACSSGKDNFRVEQNRISLITEHNLYCGEERNSVRTSQMYIFFFAAVLTLVTAILSDIYGRKKMFTFIFMVFLGGSIISYFNSQII